MDYMCFVRQCRAIMQIPVLSVTPQKREIKALIPRAEMAYSHHILSVFDMLTRNQDLGKRTHLRGKCSTDRAHLRLELLQLLRVHLTSNMDDATPRTPDRTRRAGLCFIVLFFEFTEILEQQTEASCAGSCFQFVSLEVRAVRLMIGFKISYY